MNTATDCRSGDGYRWYQVFSIAFAAHLGWSPILRDALGLKRRGRRELEKGEDGVRAQMIEEYVIALIIANAKWLRSEAPIPRATLKEIMLAVAGLEVSVATEAEWARAIEEGRQAWRFLNDRGAGFITVEANRDGLLMEATPLLEHGMHRGGAAEQDLPSGRAVPAQALELALIEVKPGVAEVFRPLQGGGWVNAGSKAEEWSRELSDGFRWHDAFHIANLVHLSWSPVAASLLDLSTSNLRAQLLEEAIIARAYQAFLSGSVEQIRAVAKSADRLCRIFGNISVGEVAWERSLQAGWDITRTLNGTGGAIFRIASAPPSISMVKSVTLTEVA
jgi:hypothetical protein